MLSPEAAAAFAPAGREDPAAAFGVPTVEDGEMLAARADVDGMVEVAATSGGKCGPSGRSTLIMQRQVPRGGRCTVT